MYRCEGGISLFSETVYWKSVDYDGLIEAAEILLKRDPDFRRT